MHTKKTLTSVFPLNSCTGSSFPAEKAKVQRAHADLSSNPARSLYKPATEQFTQSEFCFKPRCENISDSVFTVTFWLEFIQEPLSAKKEGKLHVINIHSHH